MPRDHSVDSTVLALLDKKSNSLKSLAKGMAFDSFELPEPDPQLFNYTAFDVEVFSRAFLNEFVTTSQPKENKRMTQRLRVPTETIERRDVTAALAAAGHATTDIDELMNLLAHVQDLDPGERIIKARKLTNADLGRTLTVISGEAIGSGGWLTDLVPGDRENDYKHQAVLDGVIVKLDMHDFVIVGTEFDESEQVDTNHPDFQAPPAATDS